MRRQAGVTMVELLMVVVFAAIIVVITLYASTSFIGRSSMRGATTEMVSFLQLARIEAVSRNRDCRFVVDTASRALEIWDSMGTMSTADDVRIHAATVPSVVNFGRPDVGATVTLDPIGTSDFQTIVASDGTVSVGVGSVFLAGAESYGCIDVQAAGGVQILYWNGSAWVESN